MQWQEVVLVIYLSFLFTAEAPQLELRRLLIVRLLWALGLEGSDVPAFLFLLYACLSFKPPGSQGLRAEGLQVAPEGRCWECWE